MGSTNSDTRGPRRAIAAWITAAALLAAGCSGGGDDAAGEPAMDEAAAAEPAAEAAVAADTASAEATDDRRAAEEPGAVTPIDLGVVGRDVIVEMRVTMSSDDVQRTVASISANAATLGGGVASSDIDYGTETPEGREGGYAVLVVKVPPTAVDRLLNGLDDLGVVRSIDQSSQDVTEQLVDLDVRIRNARQSVTNVRQFMERAEDLADLVTLEGELTRRQTELERLEAQQRNLSERVALATVTIEVVPTESVPEPVVDEPDTIGDAFRTGWDAFASVVIAIGFALAVVLPFLLLAGLVALVVWIALRRRSYQPTPLVGGPPPPEPERPVSEDEIATPVG